MLRAGAPGLGAAGLLLTVAASIVSVTSWFLRWPAALVTLSAGVILLGAAITAAGAFRWSRQRGRTFWGALNESRREAWGWISFFS